MGMGNMLNLMNLLYMKDNGAMTREMDLANKNILILNIMAGFKME